MPFELRFGCFCWKYKLQKDLGNEILFSSGDLRAIVDFTKILADRHIFHFSLHICFSEKKMELVQFLVRTFWAGILAFCEKKNWNYLQLKVNSLK